LGVGIRVLKKWTSSTKPPLGEAKEAILEILGEKKVGTEKKGRESRYGGGGGGGGGNVGGMELGGKKEERDNDFSGKFGEQLHRN